MASASQPSHSGPYVAGYDGSDASRAAVRLARMLAAPARAEVVAATVYRTPPFVPAPSVPAESDSALLDELRADALRLLETLGDEDVRTVAVPGDSPAQGLHRLAEDERAEAVCVGVTHRGPIGRLLLGGVGDRLMQGAPCPVAISPAGWDEETWRTVGVAWDGRREADVALRAAEALARRLGAELQVIGVYDPAPYLWLTSPAPAPAVWDVDELREGFERDLDEVVATLDPSVRPTARALSGLPGPTLVAASREGVDLLVTGSRGYGPLGSVLLGSVARYVADHAECPLLVVPRGTAEVPG